MVIILLFILISSFSAAFALMNRKYENTISISLTIVVMFMYLFGILNMLNEGLIIAIISMILSWAFTIFYILKNKCVKKWSRNFFSNGFFVFLIWFALASYFNFGKLFTEWDEFTHWGDIVYVMFKNNSFGSLKYTQSYYEAYPPAMSIFQYFFVKVKGFFDGNNFNEGYLYIAYQSLMFSYILPVFTNVTLKKNKNCIYNIIINAVGIVAVFLVPYIFYASPYTSVYIDTFLAETAAAGFGYILIDEKNDVMYHIRIGCICFMLVMSKSVGLLFALAVFLAYILTEKNKKCFWGVGAAIVIPKILWTVHLKIINAGSMFQNEFDIGVLIRVITGRDDTYRMQAWKSFFGKLLHGRINMGIIGKTFGHMHVIVLLIIFFLVCSLKYVLSENKKDIVYKTGIVIAILNIFYIVGLAISYLFNFADYEAEQLSSFSRYIGIIMIMDTMIIVCMVIVSIKKGYMHIYIAGLIMLVIIGSCVSFEDVFSYIRRDEVIKSENNRAFYEKEKEKIDCITTETSKIYIISQEDDGYDYWYMKYLIRPRFVNGIKTWCIHEKESDVGLYSVKMTKEEWVEQLVEDYDYVYIMNYTKEFIDSYGELFVDNSLMYNSVYKVNKITGMLEYQDCE